MASTNPFLTTIFVVEQNAFMALTLSPRAHVIENGSIALEGHATELLKDQNAKKAYLGI